MLKFLTGVIAIGTLLWGGTPYAHGQKATELYIPPGQSPGLSGRVTILGTIEAVNPEDRTIAIAGASATWSAKITSHTRIWLDRSTLRLTNLKGTFADLQKGLLVEVKYQDREHKRTGPAEWVKVRLTVRSAGSGETRK